jgi:hypothetical protein
VPNPEESRRIESGRNLLFFMALLTAVCYGLLATFAIVTKYWLIHHRRSISRAHLNLNLNLGPDGLSGGGGAFASGGDASTAAGGPPFSADQASKAVTAADVMDESATSESLLVESKSGPNAGPLQRILAGVVLFSLLWVVWVVNRETTVTSTIVFGSCILACFLPIFLFRLRQYVRETIKLHYMVSPRAPAPAAGVWFGEGLAWAAT